MYALNIFLTNHQSFEASIIMGSPITIYNIYFLDNFMCLISLMFEWWGIIVISFQRSEKPYDNFYLL